MFWQYSELRKHLELRERSFTTYDRSTNTSTLWFIFTNFPSDLEPEQTRSTAKFKNFSKRKAFEKNIFISSIYALTYGFQRSLFVPSLSRNSKKSIPVDKHHKQTAINPVISNKLSFHQNFLLPKNKNRALNQQSRCSWINRTAPQQLELFQSFSHINY